MEKFEARAMRNVLAISLVIVLLGGCTSKSARNLQSDTSIAPPVVASIPAMVSTSGKSLPIEAYLITESESVSLGNGYELALKSCMKRYGFDYQVPLAARSSSNQTSASLSSRYGLTDSKLAATVGYKSTSAEVKKIIDPPITSDEEYLLNGGQGPMTNADMKKTASASAGSAVHGQPVPDHGCSGAAYRSLYAPDGAPTDADIALAVKESGSSLASNDSRVKTVIAAWAKCMNGAGYQYKSPLDVPNDPTFTSTSKASQAEIDTAVKDVACKASTNLIGTWFTVESAYENVLIQRHFQELQKVRQNIAAALDKAAKLGS